MSFHDPVNKRQADDESESRNNPRDWYKRSPEAFSQAEAHYSNRLADAFESITCERLLAHDPSIDSIRLRKHLSPSIIAFLPVR